MIEFSTINLVLGIIGTVTGIMALFIHFWRLRRENPRLATNVLKCEHDFTVSQPQTKTILFWAGFQINNRGDRGTSINDVDLVFVNKGKEYRLKKQYFRDVPIKEPRYVSMKEPQRIWISPHVTIDALADFWGIYEGDDEDQIECAFTIHHTHGAERLKAISQRRKEE